MKHHWKRIIDFLFPQQEKQNIAILITTHTKRLFITSIFLVFGFFIIIATLIRISIENNKVFITKTRGLPRADIIDRNGVVLATTLKTVSLATNPKQVIHPYKLAIALHKIFPHLKISFLYSLLNQKKDFLWIKRNLTPTQQTQVIELGNPALFFLTSYPRIYPLGSLFSHIIGFTNIDGEGISGLEKAENSNLIENTKPLIVSLDARLQFIMQNFIKQGVNKFHAKGGAGILLNIHTGQILAITSVPDFDPNHPENTTPEQLFNRATLGVYELGSTFKIFTIAIGLDTGKITLDNKFDVSRPFKIGHFIIHDDIHKSNIISVSDVFNYSSNIAAAKISLLYGEKIQKSYFKKFGLLQPVQLNIPEIGTPIIPKNWNKTKVVTMSYGYGIAISPLQNIIAIASIIGPNYLIHPTLLVQNKNYILSKEPLLKNKKIIKQLRTLMYLNMLHGTGKMGYLPEYRLGGKTGTAELFKSHAQGYWSHTHRLTSFAGIFPIDKPHYALYVFFEEPHKSKQNPYSAESAFTAVPIAKKIIIQLAPILQLKPQNFNNLNFLQEVNKHETKN